MKFETLTYSAVPTDYSVASVVGSQETLLTSPQGALSDELLTTRPLSAAVLQLWMWVSLQISACLAKYSRLEEPVSQPSHIWHLPSTNPDANGHAVRVNRSMLRKLRRLQRLHPSNYFDGPAYRSEGEREGLSPSQYLEYMIRFYKWSRVRVFGLNPSRRDLMLRAVKWAGLQGDAFCLRVAGRCNARLSPD